MDNHLRVGQDIADRLAQLASLALKIAAAIPKDPIYREMAKQLARAGTAGGANYAEARVAESRADFIHKVGVAGKEVQETLYWLAIVRDAALGSPALLKEAIRIGRDCAAILGASARTAQRNA